MLGGSSAADRAQTGLVTSDVDDQQLEQAVLRLLDARRPTATICPSDVARAVGGDDSWRSLMEPVRRAAARLVAAGEVEITQGGEVVDLGTARGPIRIRRVRGAGQ